MKWLDPNTHPIPLDEIFIGYIENKIHPIKWNPDLDVFFTFEQLYNDYGSLLGGIFSKIQYRDIMHWMPLPSPPTIDTDDLKYPIYNE